MKKFIALCKRLPENAGKPWYPYVLAAVAFADYFLFVIPLDAMVVGSVIIARKRWLSISFWACLGSTLGSVVFAILIQHFGESFLQSWAPHLLEDHLAVLITHWLQDYGFWALLGIAMGPIHQHPAVAIAALAHISLFVIFSTQMLGRFTKYCIYTWVSKHAKNGFSRFFKKNKTEAAAEKISEDTITHRIAEVRSQIIRACERSGRDPQSVKLLLASKTVDPLVIREAFHAGTPLFGENRVQEFVDKLPSLNDLPIEWHFIGQLQSNKVRAILPNVKLIHSLDRLSLAEELQKQAEKMDLQVNVLLEVNSSGEKNKGGISPDQAPQFVQDLKKFDRLHIQGLMTVAIDGGETEVRACYQKTKQLLEQLRPSIAGHELSMGMSGDFEWAIEEGATLIRVGSKVFGKRV